MASIKSLLSKVRWSLKQRGVAGTLRAVAQRASSGLQPEAPALPHPFDVEYGVDTGGLIGGGDLTTGHAHDVYITAYAGIAPSRFHGTMQRWLETPPAVMPESYTFVDLGCGKGRAVMLASQLHFRETIGVELNPELARSARTNLEIWTKAGHAPRPVRIVCGDATEFALPPGPCLIYMANPFGAPVMRRLLEKLEARATAGAGTLDIVYQNPEQEAVFTEFPKFLPLWCEVIPRSQADTAADLAYSSTDRCSAYRR